MSYHKSQKINPRRDEEKIEKRRKEIKKGEIVVLFEDECRVKHGDSLGCVWGKRNERVSIKMLNERDSKTFFEERETPRQYQ